LNSLPTCLFIVAELDPLRDDSYRKRQSMNKIDKKRIIVCYLDYREILEKAGVKTKLVSINGAIHPFFSYPGKKTEDGTFDYHFY